MTINLRNVLAYMKEDLRGWDKINFEFTTTNDDVRPMEIALPSLMLMPLPKEYSKQSSPKFLTYNADCSECL